MKTITSEELVKMIGNGATLEYINMTNCFMQDGSKWTIPETGQTFIKKGKDWTK